ncbi:type 1 glutamine amidotransferase [Thioclava sp. GXIMD4216]|uniref:type 1 glutamine amidotransferase n=1 Tax=Thioclava sp. GXIMD4216 TaxID=3131929 RepID=UPI0030CA8D3E
MKIGILQTGTSPDELKPIHGDYDDLFKRLLAGKGFSFATWRVLDGELPHSVHDADGWLITGSKFGVYEDHPWIAPLEAFLRAAYAAQVPIVGVCFGHQILAQALGGKVEKFAGGWSVGATEYRMEDGSKQMMMAWHQDQVVVPPPEAHVIGQSDFCANAMLAYGTKALSVQPHPEFSPSFLSDLLEARQAVLPPEIAERAYQRLDVPLSADRFGEKIADFFKMPR